MSDPWRTVSDPECGFDRRDCAADRDDLADDRDDLADDRDDLARDRDSHALDRDMAALVAYRALLDRLQAAEQRDVVAAARDKATALVGDDDLSRLCQQLALDHEAAVTDRTAAILPVHLGGAVADMDTILAVAAKRRLPVVEDACQSHLAEWRGRKAGTLGTTGCFSFQVSKNLSSGEGGAVLSNDEALLAKCYSFHNNNGAPKKY